MKQKAVNKRTSAAAASRGQPKRKKLLRREDWIAGAREELIEGGLSALKIGRIARRLGVTRGGFYWHFKDRAQLLDDLLKSWEFNNTAPFERSLVSGGQRDGLREFLTVVRIWLDEMEYSSLFDTAVRDWARVSKKAAAAVLRVDDRRIDVLHRIFLDLGYEDPEALVRARVSYFHQVGYYAVQFQENSADRLALAPIYAQVLTGLPAETICEAMKATVISVKDSSLVAERR